jgi:hypothetical protein
MRLTTMMMSTTVLMTKPGTKLSLALPVNSASAAEIPTPRAPAMAVVTG